MKLTRKQHLDPLNRNFDRAHYIEKNKRSLQSLFKTLIYLSKKYKFEINELQKKVSKIENRKIEFKNDELVMCSIAARSKKIGVFGTSHELLEKSKYHKSILSVLRPLGTLGGKSNLYTKNTIGKCAEVKAANNIMQKDKKASILDIEFTTAIRPRTSESIKRCVNCVAVFGNE